MMTLLRALLGLLLILMGTNKFLGYIPAPEMTGAGQIFLGSLANTGYMIPFIAFTEIIAGALLMFASTAPFATLLLAPLSLNILMFHAFLDPAGIGAGIFVFAANIILGINYFDYYRPIFAKMLTEKVLITHKQEDGKNFEPVVVIN